MTAPKQDRQLLTTAWLWLHANTIKCVSRSTKNDSLGCSINGTTCSKISAMQLMNFNPLAVVACVFRYGSNVMPWLINSAGRTFANKCNVVTQLSTFLLSDASNFRISFTNPSAICWHALTTSFGGSFFGAFAVRSISFSSFGVKIYEIENGILLVRCENWTNFPQETYACQKAIEPLKSCIMCHADNINHLVDFSLNWSLLKNKKTKKNLENVQKFEFFTMFFLPYHYPHTV